MTYSGETLGGGEAESESMGWVRYLGLEDFAERPMIGRPDKTVADFLDVCRDHALPGLQRLAAMADPNHPYHMQYEAVYTETRTGIIQAYIDPTYGQPEQGQG